MAATQSEINVQRSANLTTAQGYEITATHGEDDGEIVLTPKLDSDGEVMLTLDELAALLNELGFNHADLMVGPWV